MDRKIAGMVGVERLNWLDQIKSRYKNPPNDEQKLNSQHHQKLVLTHKVAPHYKVSLFPAVVCYK
jgi:hypothetical protein